MSTMGLIITAAAAAGIVTIIVSVLSLISDRKKNQKRSRAHRREHVNDRTVRTILSYTLAQEALSEKVSRRA